jgi:hypothetical protein
MYMRPMREREANVRTITKSKVADEVMGEGKNEVENEVGIMSDMGEKVVGDGRGCWRRYDCGKEMANILWVGQFFPERIERVNSILILRQRPSLGTATLTNLIYDKVR